MKIAAVLLSTCSVLCAGSLAIAETKSPEEQFKAYPNRLADLPRNWSTTKPIRLQVCFNLKYPPNSPEANKFLLNWYRSISAMPFGVRLRMERVVFPAKFAYCGSLTFKNWGNNRAYETSEVFLKYYRSEWKPVVTEAQEQMTILDTDVTPR